MSLFAARGSRATTAHVRRCAPVVPNPSLGRLSLLTRPTRAARGPDPRGTLALRVLSAQVPEKTEVPS